ncbi:molybdopterin-dependent oxidoreductase [Rhodoplanes sp. TEM]|uniref:Molybdopterin-dependent oxidoreductase n=1 Tax=Rhodoplanes tepidamans TaxID=200616 RepID=A0ABT5J5Q8_RHOTP|nr:MULTISPECIES: nitrate reductase [Rhodoplanes]MDC7784848.1 molybdopterin-dependent oxidoreductase [Rhodoplanes tepidamans]MDC7982315.1 molybdopterin-dependent oxidoreductase [Rhodoplanes sp. TEM]MDQ0356324.1 assimilatory nitrate reductase catalytic subunit [Rhodoplanes tepidamans]
MSDPIGTMPTVRTTCPYCGVGCGILATPDGAGGATVAGDPGHPSNVGRLCSKGAALGETLGLATRLLHPVVDGARTSWSTALDAVATRLTDVIARHGRESVAFYLSGQLLTEDYYVANKLAKGFIGTPHVDTNSRLCMASSVAGHRRSFGADVVPGSYEDLEQADLVVLVGSNAAWCHPVLFQRIAAARRSRGTRVIAIDPRRTATAEEADAHLAVAPGQDTVLFAHLLTQIADSAVLDRAFVAAHTTGFDETLARAREIAPSLAATAARTGLAESEVRDFVRAWCATERVVTVWSQGVNQSAQGTDKVTSIVACHLATGRIGRPGMGPLSFTGQPNAMGGREVGGLANMLAAHMGFSAVEVDRVRRFWTAPAMVTGEGLKAVDLFDAVADGRIRALWVMGTNPAVSLPRADAVRDALGRLDLLVVSDNVASNDTLSAGIGAAGIHIRLPAAAWGEKDGTVTNSERRISRQRPFLRLAGEAKPDWWILSRVAERLGHGVAFAWTSPAAIFREHAALSGFENDGARAFDISGLDDLDDAGYDALAPVQWPVRRGTRDGTARLFGDGGFVTADRRARFVPAAAPGLASAASPRFPLRLNTGRVRDQWHTMTRTGLSPRLGAHRPEPFVEVHPDDIARCGLRDGGFARAETAHGSAVLRVVATEIVRPGEIFAPIHWTAETSSYGRVGPLVQGATDPHSGQPEAKATPATLVPVPMRLAGFALSTAPLALPVGLWWARIAVAGGFAWTLAGDGPLAALVAAATALFPGCDRAELRDPARDVFRLAAFDDGRLAGALFVGPAAQVPRWETLAPLLGGPVASAARLSLLSGRAPDGSADCGPVVCACHSVGREAILAAIAAGADDASAIGAAVKAGTNCGSCIPELKRLLAEVPRVAA